MAMDENDKEFWLKQKQLVQDISDAAEKSLKEEQRELFAKQRQALVGDTATYGFFIFCFLWIVSDNPFVAFSYAVGSLMGLAYAYGLGMFLLGLFSIGRSRYLTACLQESTWRTWATTA